MGIVLKITIQSYTLYIEKEGALLNNWTEEKSDITDFEKRYVDVKKRYIFTNKGKAWKKNEFCISAHLPT